MINKKYKVYKDKVENNKDIIDFLMKIKNNKIKVDFNNDESIKNAIHSHFYTKEYEEILSKLLEEEQRKLGIKNIEEVKERLLNNEITINDNELMADLYAFYNIGVLRTSKSMRDTEKFMYLYYYFSSQEAKKLMKSDNKLDNTAINKK